jgi:hypothetical protein
MAQDLDRALDELRREEPSDPTREQAEQWLEVYQQLIAMTDAMLERTRLYLADLQPAARRHVERVNVRVMEEELARFRERHSWWNARLLEFKAY